MSGVMHVVGRDDDSVVGAGKRYNFPAQVTSLVGRARHIESAVAALLAPHTRLLTLTGPPGVGKTRLALEVASEVAGYFSDGVYFVPLATLSDPNLVMTTLGQVLGMKEAGNHSLMARLKEHLAGKTLLLVLDNFEQVITSASLVGELLGAAPGLKLLVTSRELLHLYGEHDFRLPPLELPRLERAQDLDTILQNDAVQLFAERARAARPDFKLSEANARDVAEICVQLAGLPLAIELAAARTRLLPPAAILSNLKGQGQRLVFLRGGAQNLPARQQTLRGAIEWSYDLLDDAEKTLLRRLAVFVGGCTIEAVEAVCTPKVDVLSPNADGKPNPAFAASRSQHYTDLLDRLTSLVDKSLLRQEETLGGEVRFSMLEMIREYLHERLEESGESEELRRRQAFYYARLAEFVEAELLADSCVHQVKYLDLMEREHDNLRAALDWCRYSMSLVVRREGDAAHEEAEIDWHELALNMVGRLWVFWERHGYLSEGFRQLTSMLYFGEPRPTRGRAKALVGAGRLLMWQDPAAARPYLEEGVKLWRQIGNEWETSMGLLALGQMLTMIGELQAARTYLEEALDMRRALGRRMGISSALDSLGRVALRMGDHRDAEKLFKEGLATGSEAGDIGSMAFSLHGLGSVAQRQRDWEHARLYFTQSATLRYELGDRRGVADSLISLVDVLTAQGDYAQAARMSGTAEAVCESIGVGLHLADRLEHDRSVAELHNRLGPEQFSRFWAEGRQLSVEEVVELGEAPAPPQHDVALPETTSLTVSSDDLAGLTPRELEVLRMIATGMTNAQAAGTLSISPHTVNMHVRSIFTKLGVTSRSAATRYAIVNKLI